MPKYIKRQTHLYNHIAVNLLRKIAINDPKTTIIINVDKCKPGREIDEFNRSIAEVFYSKLHTSNNLIIGHHVSHNLKLLQAVDLFCNGIFDKYEHEDLSWYNCFQDRIHVEDVL